jgi:hypothetical protein
MTDTTVQLGDFTFAGFEIPEHLPFGGDHITTVHQLLGGKRVVDAMGRSDASIQWSGRFQGENATARARYVDGLRIAGKPLALTWWDMSFTVVIKTFKATWERFYQVLYEITCEVVQDTAKPASAPIDPGTDDMVADDLGGANAYADQIADPTLTGLMGGLTTAAGNVQSFVNATQAQIARVTGPLSAVQGQVSNLVDSVGAAMNDNAIGGMGFGGTLAAQIASISAQVGTAAKLPVLYNLSSTLDRISTNLSAVTVAGVDQTVAGGDLAKIAAQTYGDATAWTTIARANSLTDPVLVGVQTIRIPPAPDGLDGVLSI